MAQSCEWDLPVNIFTLHVTSFLSAGLGHHWKPSPPNPSFVGEDHLGEPHPPLGASSNPQNSWFGRSRSQMLPMGSIKGWLILWPIITFVVIHATVR